VDGDILLEVWTATASRPTQCGWCRSAIGEPSRTEAPIDFASHDGDVTVADSRDHQRDGVRGNTGGGFEATFPVTIMNKRKGKRFSFTLGNGSAKLEMESFGAMSR